MNVARPAAGGSGRLLRLHSGPFERTWRVLTSVRFALWLIGVLVTVSMVGVILPQMPEAARSSPEARRVFLEEQGRYGPLTGILDTLGLFRVFYTTWFNALLVVLVVSITVCTISRFPPIWRQVARPQLRVSDRYFETAHHRADGPAAPVGELTDALRRRRYRVVVVERGSETRLYADRFRWSQLGTFATHLALIVFLVGGLVTWRLGDREDVLVAEGRTGAVFPLDSGSHMQVRVVDFVRELDEEGRERAVYTDLQVYRQGELIAEGRSTINDPLTVAGYHFHQSAFFEDGVEIEVREAGSGRLLYSEVVALGNSLPVPVLALERPDGVTTEVPAPATFIVAGGYSGSVVELPWSGEVFAVAVRRIDGVSDEMPFELAVSMDDGIRQLRFGERMDLPDGGSIGFGGMTASAATIVTDLPAEHEGEALIQLVRGEEPFLLIVAPDGRHVRLAPGESEELSGLAYSFAGQRSFSGITVRRDPGATFIWVAAGLMVVGLASTFYLPRRRLWARVTGDRVQLAGIASRGADFRDEMQGIIADSRRNSAS